MEFLSPTARLPAPRVPAQDTHPDAPLDCIVIGGGPAGLSAAIYLARFRRRIAVIDGNASRAAMIPRTYNHPGFPSGITGTRLLRRMRRQLAVFGVTPTDGVVSCLRVSRSGLFKVVTDRVMQARTVILATGVQDRTPLVDGQDAAIRAGQLRQCPVCDAYELIDQPIGVIGHDQHAASEAMFLRHYTPSVTLLTLGARHSIPQRDLASLDQAGVRIDTAPVSGWDFSHRGVTIRRADTPPLRFAAIYSGLGSDAQNGLGCAAGATVNADGFFTTDGHQQTNIPGLFATGDVAAGLNQIAVAMGQAEIAATHVHTLLREGRGETLETAT
ncbi:MAG: NAD(P)/FAD-dependent oxidoreductase [Paracoccus sp. (in: a-proteobacteria)]